MSATRRWVNAFAGEMEAKLLENSHKGGREGWAQDTGAALMIRLREEVDELGLAVAGNKCCGRRDKEQVVREAADVANFAMMIADVAGGMKPTVATYDKIDCRVEE